MGQHIQHRMVPDPSMTAPKVHRGDMVGQKCVVEGCDHGAVTRWLCPKHYYRLRKYGSPDKLKQAADGEIPAWIAAHVNWPDKDACLIWPFGMSRRRDKFTYPVAGKRKGHAAMCEAAHGPAPADRPQCAHSCDNPSCVNPHHLRWASHQENMHDMVVRGRAKQGENHEKAKLNRAAVAAIKVAQRGYGRTKELANRYGVAVGTINAIWRGQTWKSVT